MTATVADLRPHALVDNLEHADAIARAITSAGRFTVDGVNVRAYTYPTDVYLDDDHDPIGELFDALGVTDPTPRDLTSCTVWAITWRGHAFSLFARPRLYTVAYSIDRPNGDPSPVEHVSSAPVPRAEAMKIAQGMGNGDLVEVREDWWQWSSSIGQTGGVRLIPAGGAL